MGIKDKLKEVTVGVTESECSAPKEAKINLDAVGDITSYVLNVESAFGNVTALSPSIERSNFDWMRLSDALSQLLEGLDKYSHLVAADPVILINTKQLILDCNILQLSSMREDIEKDPWYKASKDPSCRDRVVAQLVKATTLLENIFDVQY